MSGRAAARMVRDDQCMADEPNKNFPVEPHDVPAQDPARGAGARTPGAAQTHPVDAARPVNSEQEGAVPRHDSPQQGAPQQPAQPQPQHAAAPKTAVDEDEDGKKPPIPIMYALKCAIRGFSVNQLTTLAAALTYYAVLAVAPTLVALVSILGVVGTNGETVVKNVLDVVKDLGAGEAVDTIEPILTQVADSPGAGIALIVGVLLALWSASAYVTAFSRASNRIYGVTEGRPIWKLRPAMYLVTFVLIVIVAIAAATIATTPDLVGIIGDLINLSGAVILLWKIIRWPLVVLLALIAIALLYRRTPNVRQRKFRLISWGSGLAIIVWAAASVGLGFYVSNFANYGATYGALSGVIIFLLWVWISNLALLFGVQLDAELERGRQLRSGIIAEEAIQLPRRDTAASDKLAAKQRKAVAEGREIRETLTGTGAGDPNEIRTGQQQRN